MGAAYLSGNGPPLISSLEKLIGTPRDGALLRYSLGVEYLKAGDRPRAIERLREALERDPDYSAAWKLLGRALAESDKPAEALEAWKRGIEAAQRKGDRQAEKEMTVFARRLERSAAK
jgi:predicted Zn-dependent protease